MDKISSSKKTGSKGFDWTINDELVVEIFGGRGSAYIAGLGLPDDLPFQSLLAAGEKEKAHLALHIYYPKLVTISMKLITSASARSVQKS
jgi:hypothetical protein